jgi:hypothetical protein
MAGKSDVRGLRVKHLQEIFGRQDPGQTYNKPAAPHYSCYTAYAAAE